VNKLFKTAVCVSICILPMISFAANNVNVINHTKSNATANAYNPSTAYHSPCSSYLGSAGIITPEYNDSKPYVIPGWAIGMTCAPKCEVAVYMDNDCKTRKIATGIVSAKDGIGEVKNLQSVEGFYVTRKSSSELIIEGGSKATIFDRMFRQLGV